MLSKELIINRVSNRIFQKIAVVILFLGIFIFSSYQNPLNKEAFDDFFLPATQSKLNQKYAAVLLDSSLAGNLEQMIANFYYEVNYKPVWTFESELNEKGQSLLELLNQVEYYGLRTDAYGTEGLHGRIVNLRQSENHAQVINRRFELESMMTEIGFRLLINLHKGRVDFDTLRFTASLNHSFIEKLHIALHGDFKQVVLSVQPSFVEYKRLQAANQKFIEKVGLGPTKITLPYPVGDEKLARQSAATVLYHWGLLDTTEIMNDSVFIDALKKYQRMHSIKPNGLLTRQTVERMNTSTDELFAMVADNLDYYRKNRDMRNTCIYVNIPSFSLKLIHNNNIIKNYNVVVGKQKSPTPLLEGDLSTIVTNPYWTVPKRIALTELVPKIREDSTYMARNGFKLIDQDFNEVDMENIDLDNINYRNFNYKFRQESFGGNALGKVKFLFDNPYHVYLHDTPNKTQFNDPYRAYSHGCIRVQDPMDFAADLLQMAVIDHPQNKSKLKSDKREFINLQQPVKIYITYNLCGVDENNDLVFYHDIYNYNKGRLN